MRYCRDILFSLPHSRVSQSRGLCRYNPRKYIYGDHYTDVIPEERTMSRISNRNARTCSELHEPNKTIYYVLYLVGRCLSLWKIKSPAGNPSNLAYHTLEKPHRNSSFGILSSVSIEATIPFIHGT